MRHASRRIYLCRFLIMLFAALIYNRSSLNELLFTLYRFRIEKIQDITCIGVNFIHHIENENEANIHQV